MEFRQLEYFLAVARHGSFSSAAARIRIAQPALSAQVAKLEQELGCGLFRRHSRGADLTPAGRLLRAHALDLIERRDALKRQLGRASRTGKLEVTVALPPLVSMVMTVPLVEAARAALPNVRLRMIEGMSGAIREWLRADALDLAMLHNVAPGECTIGDFTIDEELLLLSAPRHYPAGRGTLGPEILRDRPLITSTSRNSMRQMLEGAARRCGFALDVVAEVDSLPEQRALLLKEIGASVVPRLCAERWKHPRFKARRLEGAGITWRTSLVLGSNRAIRGELASVVDFVSTMGHKLVREGRWPGARPA
ncbi:MAG: LysR family transcriptional regulator [Rhodospirillaceae bacterium]|nr:LysR family transcriptional regulator [Rhodospirillaceae bacterium]